MNHDLDPDCHEKFELCADGPATGRIGRYIAEAQRWMTQAKLACRKEDQ